MYDRPSLWNKARDIRNQHLLMIWYGLFKVIVYWGDSRKESLGVSSMGATFKRIIFGNYLLGKLISIPAWEIVMV